jgi:hypothetical protein
MARWAYILHLTHQLLWTRRGAQRIVASVCVTGIALGLMLQIVVRGVMDGMVREIDAGVHACMPDLLITSRSRILPGPLPLPATCTATLCQAGIAATPHGLSRYITWHNPELIAPLIINGQHVIERDDITVYKLVGTGVETIYAVNLSSDYTQTSVTTSTNAQLYTVADFQESIFINVDTMYDNLEVKK